MVRPLSSRWTGFSSASQTDYSDVSFKDSSGIYYENIGHGKMVVGKWRLITHLPISKLEERLSNLQSAVKDTEQLCDEAKSFKFCNASISLLEGKVDELKAVDDSLTHLLGHHTQKRALFGFVGDILKPLFGTLDEYDAEYYNEAINKANNNELRLVQILREQSQVVQSTIANFNATISQINNEAEVLNNNFANLEHALKLNSEEIKNVEWEANFNSHIALLTLFSERLNNQYNQLGNAIYFARLNVVHPILITPKQFMEELRSTIPHLPGGSTYPVPLRTNTTSQLLAISTVKIYFQSSRLICVINIPLVNTIDFFLYNLIPFPSHYNESAFIFIQPSTKYIALSYNKRQYSTLDDIAKCKELTLDTYVCKSDNPIYSTITNPICETILVSDTNQIPLECDKRIIKLSSQLWHKLTKENKWLYVSPNPSSNTISCDNQPPYDIIIKNSGLFSLTPGCKMYTSNSVLIPDVTKSSNFTHIFPSINLNIDCCFYNEKSRSSVPIDYKILKPVNTHFHDLNTASHKLDHIQQLSNMIFEQNAVGRKTHVFEYIGYAIGIFIILYSTIRFSKPIISLILWFLPKIQTQHSSPAICCNIFNVCKESIDTSSHISLEAINGEEEPINPGPIGSSPPRRSSRLKERSI